MTTNIIVEGKEYEVIETLPYHGIGRPAKIIKDPTSETGKRVVIKQDGKWRFWVEKDRIKFFK